MLLYKDWYIFDYYKLDFANILNLLCIRVYKLEERLHILQYRNKQLDHLFLDIDYLAHKVKDDRDFFRVDLKWFFIV